MKYRIWYSTEPFADFVIDNTVLGNKTFVKKKMFESDANNAKNFHTMPDHKQDMPPFKKPGVRAKNII